MHWTLPDTIGALATVLAFLTVAPQVAQLRAATTAAGVSLTSLANSLVSGIAWTSFGASRHDVWIALPAAVTVPPTAAALYLGWTRGGRRDRLWLPYVWAGALTAVSVSGHWFGQAPLAGALGVSVLFLIAPAVWSVWRSADVSGVAASAWMWLIVEASLTGAYGLLVHVSANVLYAAIAVTGAVAVLVRLATTQPGPGVSAAPEPPARSAIRPDAPSLPGGSPSASDGAAPALVALPAHV